MCIATNCLQTSNCNHWNQPKIATQLLLIFPQINWNLHTHITSRSLLLSLSLTYAKTKTKEEKKTHSFLLCSCAELWPAHTCARSFDNVRTRLHDGPWLFWLCIALPPAAQHSTTHTHIHTPVPVSARAHHHDPPVTSHTFTHSSLLMVETVARYSLVLARYNYQRAHCIQFIRIRTRFMAC